MGRSDDVDTASGFVSAIAVPLAPDPVGVFIHHVRVCDVPGEGRFVPLPTSGLAYAVVARLNEFVKALLGATPIARVAPPYRVA